MLMAHPALMLICPPNAAAYWVDMGYLVLSEFPWRDILELQETNSMTNSLCLRLSLAFRLCDGLEQRLRWSYNITQTNPLTPVVIKIDLIVLVTLTKLLKFGLIVSVQAYLGAIDRAAWNTNDPLND